MSDGVLLIQQSTPATAAPSEVGALPRTPSVGVGTQSGPQEHRASKGKVGEVAPAGPDPTSGRASERGTPVRGPMQSGDPAMTSTDRTPTSEAGTSAPPGAGLGDNGDAKTRGTSGPDSASPTTAAREPEDRLAPASPSSALVCTRCGDASLTVEAAAEYVAAHDRLPACACMREAKNDIRTREQGNDFYASEAEFSTFRTRALAILDGGATS